MLQKASIPSPRASAVLMGFRLDDSIGDAVILEGIEPSRQLDQYINELQLKGERIPDHLGLAGQIRSLVYQLGRWKLGHSDLHLGNFLLHGSKLYLLDGYAVRTGGMKMNDLLQLGHGVRGVATTADLQRGWEQLDGGGRMPKHNPVSRKWWRKMERNCTGENRYFGRISIDGGGVTLAHSPGGRWKGYFFKQAKYPRRWSEFSRLSIAAKDWEETLPVLLGQIESDQFTVLKRTPSGDVLSGEIVLAGRPLEVVIKRPRRKLWYRYFNEIGRGTRSYRAWKKSWALIARDIPTAWPLAVIERRVFGYATDQLIVFEKIPGKTMAETDFGELAPPAREMLFHRAGRMLRKLEEADLYHFDGKASNFIVRADEKLGPSPMLVDVDGIRRRRWVAFGLQRLLRSLKDNPTYTPADSLALCRGYVPYARIQAENDEAEPEGAGGDVQ
ncbi:MAG TPA: lipopolysaccharide kinase InaA family protein, partial [Tepidisphaeraceae bacterium]